jgi:transcriptional regulator with XRE-family HTH domain
MNYIGCNIRKERIKARFKQKQLAQAIGIGQAAISRFENGSRRPSVELLKKIAVVLGCSFIALVDEEHDFSDNFTKAMNFTNDADNLEEIFFATHPQNLAVCGEDVSGASPSQQTPVPALHRMCRCRGWQDARYAKRQFYERQGHPLSKAPIECTFIRTLFDLNPEISVKFLALSKRYKEMTSDDWQFLADHLMHAFNQIEILLDHKKLTKH